MKEITLLTRSNGCPNCKSVKSIISSLGIHFHEIDVDSQNTRAAPYLNKAKSRSLPLMFVGDENVASGLDCIGEVRKYAN